MPNLIAGQIIKTVYGDPIVVKHYINEGGQARIYEVEYKGGRKALKWYKMEALNDKNACRENLERNIAMGSPDSAFLWPQVLTEEVDGSFGYIMDLRPESYQELSHYIATEYYNLDSFRVAVKACLHIASAFRILHNLGMSYQDINDGNIFIDPHTGDVKIGDTDNIAYDGTRTGILGKPRYMAPEIVVAGDKAVPDERSDCHSLAEMLFLILFSGHPLEGEQWKARRCLTDAQARALYGINPVFIFDPKDASNRPSSTIKEHATVITRWGLVPDYVRRVFINMFSHESLHNPNARPREHELFKELARFGNEIAVCPACGEEIFITGSSDTHCDGCNCRYEVRGIIGMTNYSVAAVRGATIYRGQLGICDVRHILDPVVLIVEKGDGTLGLRNKTSYALDVITPSGRDKQLLPNQVVPFMQGMRIRAYGYTIELR